MLQASLLRFAAFVYSIFQSEWIIEPESSGDTLKVVKTAFEAANISQEAYLKFDPVTLLEVTFPQVRSVPVQVSVGDELERNQTAIPPIFWLKEDPSLDNSLSLSEKYVVAIVDLDPPTPQNPSRAQVRHFLGGNFEVSSKNENNTPGAVLLTNSTPAITEFRQPTPPSGSDPHRVPTEKFDGQTEVNSTTPVQNFNISRFALDTGLGDPLGGTYIVVGPDDSRRDK